MATKTSVQVLHWNSSSNRGTALSQPTEQNKILS